MKPIDTTKTQFTFFEVCRLLWDRKGWKRTWFMDEVTYKNTGLRFYLNESCVILRNRNTDAVYTTNPFTWIVFNFLCWFINPAPRTP